MLFGLMFCPFDKTVSQYFTDHPRLHSASDDGSRVHMLTIAFSSSVPITSCCKSESISFLDDKRIAERFKITMVMIKN